jgi:hypothetical protein
VSSLPSGMKPAGPNSPEPDSFAHWDNPSQAARRSLVTH